MKKEKAKSESKKAKKELEDKLATAFAAVVAEYGKAKKSKSIIEKFAKQLGKKIDFKSKAKVGVIVTEESATEPVQSKPTKVKAVKVAAETTK